MQHVFHGVVKDVVLEIAARLAPHRDAFGEVIEFGVRAWRRVANAVIEVRRELANLIRPGEIEHHVLAVLNVFRCQCRAVFAVEQHCAWPLEARLILVHLHR